jgi:DNA-binding PucR family transcriptional regulator
MDLARNRKDRGLFFVRRSVRLNRILRRPGVAFRLAASAFSLAGRTIALRRHLINTNLLIDIALSKENPMAEPVRHLPEEADIGSGEKNPGQKETEKMIEQVGDKAPQPGQDQRARDEGKAPDTPARTGK